MKEKTLNERVKDMVRNVVMDEDYEDLQYYTKKIEKELSDDEEFQKLQREVEIYRLRKYATNKGYQKVSSKCLYTAFRAASKTIKGIRIPFDYLDDPKDLAELSGQYIANTDSRIASLICRVNDRFNLKMGRTKKMPEYEPYTFAEIRKLVELIWEGILEREEVRKQVAMGKRKR